MGCGSSVAALPEHAITYDNHLPARDTKNVRSSESYDSGVGYELGSKESTSVDDEGLPDLKHLNGPTFADRRPLPPHPFEATFTERTVTSAENLSERSSLASERLPTLRGMPSEACNDIERTLQPVDKAAELPGFISEESECHQVAFIESLPRPPTPEFMVSGEPLRPLRGNPQRTASQKRSEIFTAVNQSTKEQLTAVNHANKPVGPKGDHLLFDLHRSIDPDTQVAARPPSRGGLAFDLVFGEQQELQERVERLKKRQKSKAPKLPKKTTKSQVQKKLIEADVRRQQQQLETITKLSETHSTVEEIGNKTNKMEEMRRAEMKQAQQAAMNKALAARKQHLEEMRDRIKAKNEKIKRANAQRFGGPPGSRPGTSDSHRSSNQLPSLLSF